MCKCVRYVNKMRFYGYSIFGATNRIIACGSNDRRRDDVIVSFCAAEYDFEMGSALFVFARLMFSTSYVSRHCSMRDISSIIELILDN